MIAAFVAAAAAIALWLLIVARSALNNLSTLALSKMAEGEDRLSRIIHEFTERQPSFLVSLQAGTIAAAAALVVSCERLPFLDAVSGLTLGLIASIVIVALGQIMAAASPAYALLIGLPFLRVCCWLLAPLSFPLGALLARLLARYHGRQPAGGEGDKEGEIAALIDVGQREGILEGDDSELVQNVLEFGDTVVREVMTARTDMVCAPEEITTGEAVALLARARHTRLPLYKGQVDNVTSIVTAKDLLVPVTGGEKDAPAKRFSQPPLFVPENKPISKLLRELQQQKSQIALVVDEYGGISGLCTTEDIVGEIQESSEADESPFTLTGPDVVEALGRAPVNDVAEALGAEIKEGSYDSVAGWVITALGSIPKSGERLKIDGLEVEVLSADRKRVHRVRVARPPLGDAEPQQP